jgi:hypothetical protein
MITPVRRFVESEMRVKAISRSQMVRKIGYRNINKGLRRLDRYLDTLNSPDSHFPDRLAHIPLVLKNRPFRGGNIGHE